ncbi:MAG: hypothetical protein LBS63_00660 [Prevotellaceae bacterium]|nr:hypothetical protein [Prevotellaceae bacterium]
MVRLLATLSAIALLCASCEEERQFAVEPEFIKVNTDEVYISYYGLGYDGHDATITVNASAYYTVTLTQDELASGRWLTLSTKAGAAGETIITLYAQANSAQGAEPRNALLELEMLDGQTAAVNVLQYSVSTEVFQLAEDFGTAEASLTDLRDYNGWTRNGIGSFYTRYRGEALVDNANPSSGYEDASGDNNILFAEENAEFIFGKVETKGAQTDSRIEYYRLLFGVYAEGGAWNADELLLLVSKDGDEYFPWPYTCDANNGWALAQTNMKITVPEIYFKLVSLVPNKYRVDDIKLRHGKENDGAEEVYFFAPAEDGTYPGYLYWEEDFNWVTFESFPQLVGGSGYTNERKWSDAISAQQGDTLRAHGFSVSSPTTDEKNRWKYSENPCHTFFRQGFLKVGETNKGGVVLSPEITTIGDNPVNVKVHFDAAVYASSSGEYDNDGLTIEVEGDGFINGQSDKQVRLSIVNRIVSSAPPASENPDEQDVSGYIGPDRNKWNHMSVVVSGATKTTRIRFRSTTDDATLSKNSKSSRFFFDNFRVEKL